ncbi:glycosyltransferase [Planctomyces sp. SH-PL62]|uniref:glycosyltransferase n=1 Tax=Planctomyces sp. SH-PL62 TaxID=1636152 RepID=UPI00078CE75A|nr:glycosyltransferase [Planctomyces sp. SH-PL62]AMV39360.1 Capsular glucan synthase [Planctomyces sp. SH-PL62]
MAQVRFADVIVPVTLGGPAILARLRTILECSGPALRRLMVVEDGCADRVLAQGLAELAAADPRLQTVRCPRGLAWVDYANRGLAERDGDAILLAPDALPTPGWIEPLAAAAHSEERVALATPISHGDGFDANAGLDEEGVRRAIANLPETLFAARAGRLCNYLRGDVLDAVGLLDDSLGSPRAAVDDWLMRAGSLGFFAKRAGGSLVLADPPETVESGDGSEPAGPETLEDRHIYMKGQVDRHAGTLDGSIAAHAVDYQFSKRIKVALDLRHLPLEMNGTKMYAVNLGKALAARPEVELTLLAAHPLQADGVEGRLVSPEDWADDAAILHKPAQIFDRSHARLLFESRAHVVLTYQDLIAYRMAHVFPNEAEYNAYQQTSRLTLPAAQAVLTYSENTAREVEAEFGLDPSVIHPVFLGVDLDAFASPVDEDETATILENFDLPPRYLLSLASDYPHKNLPGLLEAYAMFREWWTDGEPPALALAGRAPRSESDYPSRAGVRFLGAVSHQELRALYQNTQALVFPSLYEGFGLPPLEAMAAGVPVVAMPFSSVPEVCGDCVLYAEGLSPVHLARAMQRMAADPDLGRELREKGLKRARFLSWEKTASETLEVYRKVLLDPSAKTLQARRALSEAIGHWSRPLATAAVPIEPTVEVEVEDHVEILEAAEVTDGAVESPAPIAEIQPAPEPPATPVAIEPPAPAPPPPPRPSLRSRSPQSRLTL